MQNCTAAQKIQMQALGDIPYYHQTKSLHAIKEIGSQVAGGLYETLDQMLDTITKLGGNLLSALLSPAYSGGSDVNPVEEAAKRRKKKKKGQDQSMGIGL